MSSLRTVSRKHSGMFLFTLQDFLKSLMIRQFLLLLVLYSETTSTGMRNNVFNRNNFLEEVVINSINYAAGKGSRVSVLSTAAGV